METFLSQQLLFSRIWNRRPDSPYQWVTLLHADPNSVERWEILDTLRASAALLVFFFHFVGLTQTRTSDAPLWEALESIALRAGSLGTNLLLLLCGLLIALSVSKSHFSYPSFLLRRGMRIYLPYLSVLLLGLGASIVFPAVAKPVASQQPLQHFLEQLVLLPGLFPDRPFLTVSWTLSYVVAGYLAVPLFAIAAQRIGLPRIAAWCAVFLLCLIGYVQFGFPSIRICYIPAGCLLYELYRGVRGSHPKRFFWRWLAFVSGMAVLAKLSLLAGEIGIFAGPTRVPLVFFLSGLAAVTALCVSVLLLADRFPMQYNQAPLRWLQKLGRRGYSFYLLHGPVTKATVLIMSAALGRSAGDWRVNLCLLALSLGLSILCTDILYNLVELPAVSWMQRHSKAFSAHA